MSAPLVPVPPSEPPPDDPFRYGWRFVRVTKPDGGTDLEQVPLTLEDVLHPQEEDFIPERPIHELERGYFADIARSRPLKPPVYHVTSDCLIDWGVPGIRPHAPDVAVFVGLREEPDLEAGTFHLKPSGGRCLLVLEVVSPDTRCNDVIHKMDHYFRAGVPLYVILDQESEVGPRILRGYQCGRKGYKEIPCNADGRLPLESLGLVLSLRDNRLVCHDAETGRELGDYVRVARQLDEADRRIQEQDRALESAVLEVREERRGREAAEREREVARRERDIAEQERRQAQEEARSVKQEADARIRELEEQLRRLQGGRRRDAGEAALSPTDESG